MKEVPDYNANSFSDANKDMQKVDEQQNRWFVMRDLKRVNAKMPAYKMLTEKGFQIFTPMKWVLSTVQGRKVRKEVPFMQDLLFVHSSREILDPVVDATPTLQYRYSRGCKYKEPMIVRDVDMATFINAVNASSTPIYFTPEEITPSMVGREVRVIGGPLDNYEGRLLSRRGQRNKYLLVELKGLLLVGVKINPEYIQIIQETKQSR